MSSNELDWHRLSSDAALARLASSATGLSRDESARRRSEHGFNVLEEAPPRPPWMLLLAQFADYMILVLLGAAVIAGVVGDALDTLVIVAIVVLNALIGFVQEYRAERALAALKAMAAPVATVMRGGTPHTEPASHLVPGDVVRVEAGAIVPADLRIIESASLRVDEAALTGESVPVDKDVAAIEAEGVAVADRWNIAHKGTLVTYGHALGLVVATGMRTEFGKIAALLERARIVETPLQRRLVVFGRRLAAVVLAVAAIVFVTGLLRGEAALPMLLTALSLAVAAIPEALPAVVGIALALGARNLLQQRALIRRLPAVEALGSVTAICSDKTGTLTANEMRVEQYYCDAHEARGPAGTEPWRMLTLAMSVSHDAARADGGRFVGDPTEVALLRAALEAGRDHGRDLADWPRADEVPFDSRRKCMSTLHHAPDGTWLSFTKGAVEVIVAAAENQALEEGTAPLDRATLEAVSDRMAADGQRVLAFGVRRFAARPQRYDAQLAESGLTFVGLVGLIDPPRVEASTAIASCHEAGIVPIMITGDHPRTARAIAARLGLSTDGQAVISGTELALLTKEELEQRVAKLRVYARVSPEQKLAIVAALQAAGAVVAVTGDGVNDAPALRQADIGIAMGVTGTDVAKEASGVVLLDDNFATIVAAVREGRRAYDNLRHFIRYVLTTNAGEVWTIFLAPFLGLPIPLLPIQILWINLVTDGLPGLALAAEPAERNVMRRPPRPVTESVFAHGLGAHVLFVGLLMAGIALGAEAWAWHGDVAQWRTLVFTCLCFMQLGHVLAIRSEESSLFMQGVLSNKPLAAAVALTAAAQLGVVYLAPLNGIFGAVPLTAGQLGFCVGAGITILTVVEVEKWARRSSALRSAMV
ncbi:MAG TPA: cation-translocating P-type ATPase [Gammaproteobacteria bacterium]